MNKLMNRINDAVELRKQRVADFENDYPHARALARVAVGLALAGTFIGTSDSSFAGWAREEIKKASQAAETQGARTIGEAEIRVADFACRAVGLDVACPPTGADLYNDIYNGTSVTDIPTGSLIQDQSPAVS